MEKNVTVCPKCGYRPERNATSSEKECPRCGIIYERYFARRASMEKTAPNVSRPGPVPATPAGKGFRVAYIAGISLIILFSGILLWKLAGGKGDASPTTSASAEKEIKSFPYDIRGTYGARFTSEFDGGSSGSAYAYSSDFEAKLSINEQYRVNQLAWTDYHVTLSKTRVSWTYPSATDIVCEERPGGNPEKNKEPFSQILTLQRLGNALALDYHRPSVGEVAFDWKNAFKEPLSGEEANGLFQYIKEQDALRASVKVTVVPKGVVDVPREAVSTFTGSPFWANTCIESYKYKGGDALMTKEGGYFRKVNCEKLEVFAAGSAGVAALLNLTNVDIPFEAVGNRSGSNSQMSGNPIQLTGDSRFLFDFSKYEREAEVLLYRDGRKILKIKDRKVADKPLEFALERQ